ncbi:MAG: radical SAM protein [Clostridia bacterium]|nr:radical SAM protein [Clostridia bacterium]
MSHANISIFVPHLGCPNKCSFCNQCHITGKVEQPTPSDIDIAVEKAMSSKNYSNEDTEIAFFGGSFTAIDRDYMVSLLNVASKYVKNNTVKGIRISTRPDYIDAEILDILKSYGVTAIELGAQSMVDSVLDKNDRGHKAEDVEKASKLIKDYGFELGLQMMTGLYTDTNEGSLYTAKKIIELKPKTVRIYPTIVLDNTRLAELFKTGEYIPQTVDEAAQLVVSLTKMFENNNISVIRVGLHTIDEDSYVAGPWHAAFGELCESIKYYELITSKLEKQGTYNVFVNDSEISKAIGQSKSNIKKLNELGIKVKIMGDKALDKYEIKVREVK